MKKPLISVLMPAYNAEHFISEAIESILEQTFSDFELIVIDDGSKDDTLAKIQQYANKDSRVRVISQENIGFVPTLNKARLLAQGDIIARMDADDISHPDRFEMQIKYLEEHADIVCVSGNYEYMDEVGRKLTTIYMPLNDDDIQSSCLNGAPALCHGCSMMRRWALDDTGGYIVGMEPAEDLDLWLRLGEVGKLANLVDVILKVRLHPASICGSNTDIQNDKIKIACENAYKRRNLSRTFAASIPWRPGDDRDSQFNFLIRCGWWAFNSGEKITATIYGLKAIKKNFLRSMGWRLFVSALIKKPTVSRHALR